MDYNIEKYDQAYWIVVKHGTMGDLWRVLFDDQELALKFLIEHLANGD